MTPFRSRLAAWATGIDPEVAWEAMLDAELVLFLRDRGQLSAFLEAYPRYTLDALKLARTLLPSG